jgi:hypothetical protein
MVRQFPALRSEDQTHVFGNQRVTGAQVGLSLTTSLTQTSFRLVAHSKRCGDFVSDPEQRAHHTPRHFRIKTTYAIRSNNKIRWVKNVPLDKFQHLAIGRRPHWLHQIENESR